MKITLCGSARFESMFKHYNKRLSLAGHVVYSLAVYPSDEKGKDWYTPEQKELLDLVHKQKILNSDAIYVIAPGGYIGESTAREIAFAREHGKKILCSYGGGLRYQGVTFSYTRTCHYHNCPDPASTGPCALCYE